MWIEDYRERLVNIDNWDFLNFCTISDVNTSKVVAYKFFLTRNNEEEVLGYLSSDESAELVLQQICKGINRWFSDLDGVLYTYLDKEFDEKYGEVDNEDFNKYYDFRMNVIQNLIGERFIED